MSNLSQPVELPPLPNGDYGVYTDYYDGTCVGEPFDRWHDIELFSAEQMCAYASEAVLAERERCAEIAESPEITANFGEDAAAAEVMTDLLKMYFGSVAAAIRKQEG